MAASITIGPYVSGEKPAPLEYTFKDATGAAINLTGYSAKFNYRPADGSLAAAQGNATVSATPTDGKVTYTWTGAEFSQPGAWWAEVWVGNTTNKLCSLRLEYTVRAAVGAVPNI